MGKSPEVEAQLKKHERVWIPIAASYNSNYMTNDLPNQQILEFLVITTTHQYTVFQKIECIRVIYINTPL